MRRRLVLTILLKEEEGKTLAKCLEIDGIDTFGSTIEKAKENIKEAIELYLASAKELGVLDKVIKKAQEKSKQNDKPLDKLLRNYDYCTRIKEELVGSYA